MDREIVFGNKISVNFIQKSDSDLCDSTRDQCKYSTEESSLSTSPCSSRDSSSSPPEDRNSQESILKNDQNLLSQKKFQFPPPPIITEQNFPSFIKEPKQISSSQNSMDNYPHPAFIDYSDTSKNWKSASDRSNPKSFFSPVDKFRDISAFSPFCKEQDLALKVKYPQRNVGKVSPFFMQDCESKDSKINVPAPSLNEIAVGRHNFLKDVTTNSFASFSNTGFNAFGQTVPIVLNDALSFSPLWNGCLSVESMRAVDASLPVELQVSNLDPMFEVNEIKKVLFTVFSEHVMVLHISMSLQPDGSAKATVKVPSLQDAQYAISRLHRKKIGHKRILISHAFSEKNPPFCVLKSETVALLNDIPSKCLPLIKFRELYEKRYHRPIAVSELYKMRDVVVIQGDSGSRMVYLNVDFCKTPSLPDSEDSQEFNIIERTYCEQHFKVSTSEGWAEQYSVCPLPIVNISLKTFSTAVHRLLDTHQGSLPLISFCDCYEAEIGPLPVVGDFNNQLKDEEGFKVLKGVPLEHLIACVNGVEVAKSALCIKKVQWLENRLMETKTFQSVSPALAGQLTLFGREVIDLLKNQPQCLVQFNKFIPTYHHHFGRQCRVADYGFTKLIDLLEAIPNIVQVLGEGQNRQVTLTHRTQVKRFSAELLRILKSRASKQIVICEFAEAYEQVIEKPFNITNYGVCEIEDLLEEVSENVILISSSGDETVIGIPKREQTAEEIERTKQFANEVIELMKHTPHCSMAFNKFIPSYHHHFGKQCRVADYGFTKLIELFEAIPNILEVTGSGEDKILLLVPKEQHKILTQRLVSVLKSQPNEVIDINQISSSYAQMHGHALRPSDFGFLDLHRLVESMDALRIVIGYVRTYVTLVDEEMIHQISLNIRRLLMEHPDGRLLVSDLCEKYEARYCHKIAPTLHFQDMKDFIQIEDCYVQLTPRQKVAQQIMLILQREGGCIGFAMLRSYYQYHFHSKLDTKTYGFSNLYSLLEYFSDYFIVSGKKMKRTITLNVEKLGVLSEPLPDFLQSNTETENKERSLEAILSAKENQEDILNDISHSSFKDSSPHSVAQNSSLTDSQLLGLKNTLCTSSPSVIKSVQDSTQGQLKNSIFFSDLTDESDSELRTNSFLTKEHSYAFNQSSKSTPTRSSRSRSRKSRIAASFSTQID